MDTVASLSKFHEEGSAQIYPVVLSGGAGTRLWPLSRASYPKQLLQLVSDRSMLQDTVARNLNDIGFAAPLLVCNEDHRFLVDDQLRQIVAPQVILLEPLARNTGPAIAAAALWLLARDPDALMLVQPSDHIIAAPEAFHAAVMRGLAAAQAGNLVTFGVTPDRPDTGYGYIQGGDTIDGTEGVLGVERFVEKPDLATAQRFVESGAFYWNSGIFLLNARTYIAELSRINPAMLVACEGAIRDGKQEAALFRLGTASFASAPALSIDHAVMEHTTLAAVVPVDMAWSDVGSWPALRGVAPSDGDGNVLHGDVLAHRVHNSYIRSEGRLVAAVGLDDIVVIATEDAVLVADAGAAAEVSGVVATLREQNRPEAQQHVVCHRPWGDYRTVDAGDRFQVKRITVKPGEKLSLQKHYHRAEHWVVVCGTAIIECAGKQVLVSENESFYIPIGAEHRLENPGKVPLQIIEVQSGAYLGEDDIVRLSDSYGRT